MVATLARAPAVVLHAPTGAGKTTRVPPALLDNVEGTIIVLEPRQVAARAAAARMASERGERVGQTIGHHVRFDRAIGRDTRIQVVTEGILLRRLQGDPFLEGVAAVLLDEFHERSLDADLCLAMLRRLQTDVREDLKLVVMSATLDIERVSGWLQAPVIRSEGRTHPVEIRYRARPDDRPIDQQVGEAVMALLEQPGGHILVFLPGAKEIRWTEAWLGPRLGDVALATLHGRLSPDKQDAALAPGPRRTVILSTNVAETSVTIPGVDAVVDSGLVRRASHDPRRGLDRLDTVQNSQASADQRAGRAGRTRPGIAVRLWTERQHEARDAHDLPEVLRADLAGPLLALRAWGEPDPADFPWFEAPSDIAMARGSTLLEDLGAVEGGRLTKLGEQLAALPLHPRLGRLMLEGHRRGASHEAAGVAALLSERSPFRRDQRPAEPSTSDVLDQLDALHQPGAHGWQPVGRGPLAHVRRVAKELERSLRRLGPGGRGDPEEGIRRAILAAFPDRAAVRRDPDSPRIHLASGRGAELHRDSSVTQARYLVAVDVEDQPGAEARVRLASAIDPAWLEPTTSVEVDYDPDKDRVVGSEVTRHRALVLNRRPGARTTPEAVRDELVVAAAAHPARAIPRDDRDLTRLRGRIRFVAAQRPDLELPGVDEASLLELAWELAAGRRSLAELKAANWEEALLRQVPWAARQTLDSVAPEQLEVPSGSRIRLDYPEEGPPILAVRIQELFGLADTPKAGRVPVRLHLLAPNGRPQQITDDLAGFWARTWPEVRKELRARYPRHSWPEDPLTAPAQRRPRRRR